MRDPLVVLTELEAARAAYHEAANVEPAPALAKRSEAIKALMAEFSDSIADGAMLCPECSDVPYGRLKSRERTTHTPGLKVGNTKIKPSKHYTPTIYEVGCTTCGNYSLSASQAEAVAKWNTSQYD
jgi:hypothetical protein